MFDIICGSFIILSWFNATVAVIENIYHHYFSNLLLLFFIQSEESMYDLPQFRLIL